jgi:hypothetical protein
MIFPSFAIFFFKLKKKYFFFTGANDHAPQSARFLTFTAGVLTTKPLTSFNIKMSTTYGNQ